MCQINRSVFAVSRRSCFVHSLRVPPAEQEVAAAPILAEMQETASHITLPIVVHAEYTRRARQHQDQDNTKNKS